MEMKLFDNWKDIPTIHLDLMDLKIFTGKNVMIVLWTSWTARSSRARTS